MQHADVELSFLFKTAFLGVSWIISKYGSPKQETCQKEQKLEPEPEKPKLRFLPKRKLRLLRLPLVAFKECMLSMDLNDVLNLSLCSKHTANTIKLFNRTYFKEITNCRVRFIKNHGYLDISTPTPRKTHFYSYKPLLKLPQKFAAQFLELAGCREVKMIIYDKVALEEFASWYNTYESLIKSVYCSTSIDGITIFDFVNYFENWKRVVLTHGLKEYHLNQTNQNKSISIISCDMSLPSSFWNLPHRSIHFSGSAFHVDPFVRYLRRWVESSIPCTELVDFTAELYLPNYFNTVLRSVKFEVIDVEWIHPIHGTIPPPSYKIQRIDQRKCALLFTFDKDGEPCLGMHIY
ncbi:hypothetical protein CAEBREN_04981 [Caenorhabditis brenneri]|uniref:F-box domain-containing protein n=1 Tax=Caenorhabditis brenneri TaxID=135651 RepID=G0NVN3_CAEBE|nr:hypothetical protein CAEBREN_04981 [Caenorhabditis brenneri]